MFWNGHLVPNHAGDMMLTLLAGGSGLDSAFCFFAMTFRYLAHPLRKIGGAALFLIVLNRAAFAGYGELCLL